MENNLSTVDKNSKTENFAELLEESFNKETYKILKAYRHNINVLKKYERGTFGGGQIINKFENVIISGSDPRKDGLALSY